MKITASAEWSEDYQVVIYLPPSCGLRRASFLLPLLLVFRICSDGCLKATLAFTIIPEGFPPSQKMDIRLIAMFSFTGHRDVPWKSEARIFMVIFCLQNFSISKVLCLKFQTGKNCWQISSLSF